MALIIIKKEGDLVLGYNVLPHEGNRVCLCVDRLMVGICEIVASKTESKICMCFWTHDLICAKPGHPRPNKMLLGMGKEQEERMVE